MKHLKSFLFLGFLAAFCAGTLPAAGPVPAELFRDGDRWGIVGDSITHNGSYHAWIYAYYVTRFPERTLDSANAGISGDSAAGAVRRYDWDIQPKKATVATVMLGMNDVGRGLYEKAATPDLEKRRADSLANYRKNMTELVRLLRADGVRLTFVTPSIFDETAEIASPKLTGVNGALGECAAFMRELAAANGAAVIDLHGPMTALNQRLQKADPAFTLIGPDRVHPRAPGHLVMAYYFLKGQGAPAEVSRVELDAAGLKVTAASNAEVGGLERTAGGLVFTSHEKALPYPVDNDAKPALAWVPFTEDLNQEILKVTGLADGAYALTIDGETVRTYSAGELAAGVNLALEEGTPQAKQAAAVLTLVKRRRAQEAGLRGLAQVEHGTLKDLPRPVAFEAARPLVEKKLEETKAGSGSQREYFIGVYGRYLENKPKVAETEAQIARLTEEIRAAAKPKKHRYALTPVKAGE